MLTYILMGIPFLATVLIADVAILKTNVIKQRQTWFVMALLLLMTAIFDQLLTGLPIVHYNEARMIGFRLGYAPIEDFTYTIAVVLLVGIAIQHGKDKHHI